MTSAAEIKNVAERRVIERLEAEGWQVTTEPQPDQLPESLEQFRPDLLAQRGQEHVIIEIRSRRNPPNLDMVELAERVAALKGWRLDLVYLPEASEAVSRDQLSKRLLESIELAEGNPEAGLLLAWSGAEGLMHHVAEPLGIDSDQPGSLLAAFASLGLLEDDEQASLRKALRARNALAHGREGPQATSRLVRDVVEKVRRLEERATRIGRVNSTT